jgi:hypothetical protein
MIVFGTAVADADAYRRWARVGIERVAEPDSAVLTRAGTGSIQAAYNSILDEAAQLDGLEAVVLLHEDTEICDAGFAAKLRAGFSDPDVAVIGPLGATGIDGLAWWRGNTFGRIRAPNVALHGTFHGDRPHGWHHVEAVDGCLFVVSPWAARAVRFDERFGPHFHGYDLDFCFEARALGRACVVAPLGAVHYAPTRLERMDDLLEATLIWQRKWGQSCPPRLTGLLWA